MAQDWQFERFKGRVHQHLRSIDPEIVPASWFETLMKYYYDRGYTEEHTSHTILETRMVHDRR